MTAQANNTAAFNLNAVAAVCPAAAQALPVGCAQTLFYVAHARLARHTVNGHAPLATLLTQNHSAFSKAQAVIVAPGRQTALLAFATAAHAAGLCADPAKNYTTADLHALATLAAQAAAHALVTANQSLTAQNTVGAQTPAAWLASLTAGAPAKPAKKAAPRKSAKAAQTGLEALAG